MTKKSSVAGLPTCLNVGDEVEVWIEREDGSSYFECNAILLEKMREVIPKEPFTYVNNGDKDSINAIKEKWKVKPIKVNKLDDCKPRIRWIRRFHSYGIVSLKDLELLEGDDNICEQ